MLGAAIKQPIHHQPGIGSKRLTGTDFLEMEKILVMNGMSLLEFTFELMSGIYHLKKFGTLLGCFYSHFLDQFVGRAALRKHQCNTLACLYDVALAKVAQNWVNYPSISGRG